MSWRPAPLLPLSVWWHRWSLDRRLSEGEDPAATPQLERRAAQLVSRESRERLALAIEHAAAAPELSGWRRSAAVPVCRDAIRAAQPQLLALAGDLRSGDPVRPQGVALARLLLIHGASPLYEPCDDDALRHAAEDARSGLPWT